MASVKVLELRAAIMREVRRFFDAGGFVEVSTAVRIDAPAPEEHIDCPPVSGGGYLRASPELQMKKLLAQGMQRIYQIGPCFRDGERGARHNPEFTMLEWYRKGADYLRIADDLEQLFDSLTIDGCSRLVPPFVRVTVRDMYREYAGWDPWSEWDQDRFDFDMATKIEPAVKAMGGGVFLMDYPSRAASLARVAGEGFDRHAERWEFYWDGIELANCFTELCDSDEQLLRFESAKLARTELGEADYPIDYEFIDCLSRVGSASGVALGIDRLVMVLTGINEISEVLADPV